MREMNGCQATYCFQEDKNFPEEDMGDMTLHCSRKADSFKLWLLWKAVGDAGMAHRVDEAVRLARRFAAIAMDQSALRDLGVEGTFVVWRSQQPFYCNVCFYYVPPCLKGLEEGGTPFWEMGKEEEGAVRISRVAPYIKNRMQRAGTCGMMGFCGQHNHFRLVIASPIGLNESDMLQLICDIDTHGKSYTEQTQGQPGSPPRQ
uniref:Glutamate decarboxylase n=1 Tax=Hemiselmis andersenii TaxID=464988 RepID=A0A7S1HBX0_HEMAN